MFEIEVIETERGKRIRVKIPEEFWIYSLLFLGLLGIIVKVL